MINYNEKENKQGFLATLFSVIFLSFIIYIIYYFKGELKNQDSFFILANLKSIFETGNLLYPSEPIFYLLNIFFKKLSFTSLESSYLFLSSLLLSSFLHQVLIFFKINKTNKKRKKK